MTKKCKYNDTFDVFLYYRGYDDDLDNKIEKLSRCWIGAGYDGTWRDHSFSFKSERTAIDFCNRIRSKKFGRRIEVQSGWDILYVLR